MLLSTMFECKQIWLNMVVIEPQGYAKSYNLHVQLNKLCEGKWRLHCFRHRMPGSTITVDSSDFFPYDVWQMINDQTRPTIHSSAAFANSEYMVWIMGITCTLYDIARELVFRHISWLIMYTYKSLPKNSTSSKMTGNVFIQR